MLPRLQAVKLGYPVSRLLQDVTPFAGGDRCEDRPLNTDEFLPHELGAPFGWIEPEIARYPESTQVTDVLSRGGPDPIRSSQKDVTPFPGSERMLPRFQAAYCGATTLCMAFSAAFHLLQPNRLSHSTLESS